MSRPNPVLHWVLQTLQTHVREVRCRRCKRCIGSRNPLFFMCCKRCIRSYPSPHPVPPLQGGDKDGGWRVPVESWGGRLIVIGQQGGTAVPSGARPRPARARARRHPLCMATGRHQRRRARNNVASIRWIVAIGRPPPPRGFRSRPVAGRQPHWFSRGSPTPAMINV